MNDQSTCSPDDDRAADRRSAKECLFVFAHRVFVFEWQASLPAFAHLLQYLGRGFCHYTDSSTRSSAHTGTFGQLGSHLLTQNLFRNLSKSQRQAVSKVT